MLIAHGKALFPLHLVGRGLTVLNMASMGGTFLVQIISGFVIELFPTAPDGAYALDAYRLVFGLQAGFILLACLVYFGARDPAAGLRRRAALRRSHREIGHYHLLYPCFLCTAVYLVAVR